MEKEVAKLEENQETHAPNGWGGKRANAGRKKHSRDKLVIADFLTPDDIDKLVEEIKEKVFVDKDKDMIKFLAEQIFGKAIQKTIQEDDDGNTLPPVLVKILRNENN